MTTRREFVALSAAAGLPLSLRLELGSAWDRSPRPWLEMAVRCAHWIARSAQPAEGGSRWPADPLKPESVGLDFYNGMPGVVAFYAALFDSTRDPAWRNAARGGAGYLIWEMDSAKSELDAGLYTGLAGLGYTFTCLHQARVGNSYRAAAERAAALIVARAKAVDQGAEWSDSYDIISGTAGTGLFLLHAGLVEPQGSGGAERESGAPPDCRSRAGRGREDVVPLGDVSA